MGHHYSILALYSLINGVATLLIAVLYCSVLIEARRQQLAMILRWLAPLTVAAIASTLGSLISNALYLLGYPREPWFFVYLQFALGVGWMLLTVFSVVKIRGMIRAIGDRAGTGRHSRELPHNEEDAWPPTPDMGR